MSVRPLPEALQDKAITELNEVPKRVQEDIKHIQEWIAKQPNLKIRNDDQWLLSFLRGCKFSLQRTKTKLELYYTTRYLSPEFFYNIHPLTPGIHACLTQGMLAVLPSTLDLLSPCRCFVRFKEDYEGIDYGYAAQATPAILKKAVALSQNVYPCRINGIYVLNLPLFLQVACNICLSFLSEKLRKRVYFYSKNNLEDLYQHIPRSVLPEEYGGYAGPFKKLSDKFRKFMENKCDWLLENSKYDCNVGKRHETPKHFLEFSDVEGSFRKLEID